MSAVVVLGVFVADVTFRADRLPRIGETILGRDFALGPGGKGSNQAVACGRAGGAVAILTRLGRDAFGAMAREVWSGAGVTPLATVGAAPTGSAFIYVDAASGDNAIIVAPGAGGELSPADIDAQAAAIAGARVAVTQLEQPMDAAMRFLGVARAGGAATVLNPAPAAALPEGMLSLCDYVTPNESEAEALTGIAVTDLEGARAAADALLAAGVGRAVLVTLGARGVLFQSAERSVHVPAFDVGPVVETTGAGDAFNGAFAASLSEGRDPVEAARFGCAAAAISVTRPGAAASSPERAEIEALLAKG